MKKERKGFVVKSRKGEGKRPQKQEAPVRRCAFAAAAAAAKLNKR